MLIIGRISEESPTFIIMTQHHVLIGIQMIAFCCMKKDVQICSIVTNAMAGKRLNIIL
jgi:hypothetical protein